MRAKFTLLTTLVFSMSLILKVQAQQVPTPDHVIIVIFENHGYSEIIGSSDAPYINGLANDPYGALFTQSYGVTHPSQPNYLYLFSGSSQNVILDLTPFSFLLPFTTENLGASLLQNGWTFVGYSEDLPSVGFTGDNSGGYARKHNPWVNWQDGSLNNNGIPSSLNQPLTSFPTNYDNLPTLSFVIPNQNNDMHNGTIATADAWLQTHLDGYVQWAKTNNSLLIVTFDEDNGLENNRIATIFIGQMVKAGQYSEHIDHNDVLRTLEDMYGLSYAGNSASATTITDCWVYKPISDMSASVNTICPGESVSLTDMSANNPTAWYWSFPGATPATSTSQNPVVTYNSAGSYDVMLVTSNHMGYDTLVNHNYITVDPFVSLTLSDDSLAICKGDTATVTVSGAAAYNWLPSAGLITANGNTMMASPQNDAVYQVTGSGGNCPSDTVAVAIKVNPLPIVIASPDSQSICEGDTVMLTAQGADHFSWAPATGLLSTSGASVLAAPSSSAAYTATGTDNNDCSSEADILHVLVNPLPDPVITVNDSLLSSTTAESYQWYLNGQPVSGATNQDYVATTDGNYQVEVYNASGCSALSEGVSVQLTSTGIHTYHTSLITIYPNPNEGKFILTVTGIFKGKSEIDLYDLSGRKVYQSLINLKDNNPLSINASPLDKGIYLLTITQGKHKESTKFFVY